MLFNRVSVALAAQERVLSAEANCRAMSAFGGKADIVWTS